MLLDVCYLWHMSFPCSFGILKLGIFFRKCRLSHLSLRFYYIETGMTIIDDWVLIANLCNRGHTFHWLLFLFLQFFVGRFFWRFRNSRCWCRYEESCENISGSYKQNYWYGKSSPRPTSSKECFRNYVVLFEILKLVLVNCHSCFKGVTLRYV